MRLTGCRGIEDITLQVTLLCLCAAAAFAQPPAPVTEPAGPQELLQRLVGMSAQIPGAAVEPQPGVTMPQTLAQAAPDLAPVALSYSYQWGARVRVLPASPPQPLTLDVHRLADPLDAFGVFAHFRPAGATIAQVPTQSYWQDDTLHVWRGAYYLRVAPQTPGALVRAAVLAAGQAAAGQLPLPNDLPLMMRLMPTARAVPNSLRYYRQNVLGQVGLGDGLVGSYLEDQGQLQLALLRSQDPATASAAYDRALRTLAGAGAATPVPLLGERAAMVTNVQFGLTYVLQQGAYVVLALGVHDRQSAESLLRIMATSIRITKE